MKTSGSLRRRVPAMSQIPILMYHALEDENHPSGSRDSGARFYEISTKCFHKQMRLLSTKGYHSHLLEEVLQRSSFSEKIIVLTFDDGHSSNYDLALPILQQYGFRAEFFITTDWIGKPGYLSAAEIREMSQLGMAIGSHGVTHSFLDDLTDDEILAELGDSRRTLCEITGKEIASFSAPGGRINKDIIKLGYKAGYKIFCGSRFEYFHKESRLACIPRLVITTALNLSDFALMAEADPGLLKRKRKKYFLLSYLKRILGNKVYAKLHSLVSRGRRSVSKQ